MDQHHKAEHILQVRHERVRHFLVHHPLYDVEPLIGVDVDVGQVPVAHQREHLALLALAGLLGANQGQLLTF